MSHVTAEELHEVLEVVCMTVLELPVEFADGSEYSLNEYRLCSITISGAWNGTVQVRAGVEFLTCAASHMFKIDRETVDDSDRADTFTELINMLGGTIKCLLPEPSDLSLPVVLECNTQQISGQSWHHYLCDGHPLAVAVTERHRWCRIGCIAGNAIIVRSIRTLFIGCLPTTSD